MSEDRRPEDEESTDALSAPWRPGQELPELRLLVVVGGRVETVPLPRVGRVLVGRQKGADVRVDHESVSRRHAMLSIGTEQLALRDLGSHNGTHLGGERLEPGRERAIDPDTVVRIGAVTLAFQAVTADPEGGAAEPPPEPPSSPDLYAGTWLRGVWPSLCRIAAGQIPVLLTGETGVGKEVLVGLVHGRSRRARAPLVAVNCAALPPSLLESELFGHERGAFTGATEAKVGTVGRAHGGTLFLDEVGELPSPLQAKLLRVLESGEYHPVGADRDLVADVRLVAATAADLEAAAEAGAFRKDLLYRINAFSLVIPPLRERRDEIPGLVDLFVRRASEAAGVRPPSVSEEVGSLLAGHSWPGNVRELRNVVDRAVLLCGEGASITGDHLPQGLAGAASRVQAGEAPGRREAALPLKDAVREAEKRRIVEALERSAGNQTAAAKLLGISRRTLVSRLEDHGLPRPRKKHGA